MSPKTISNGGGPGAREREREREKKRESAVRKGGTGGRATRFPVTLRTSAGGKIPDVLEATCNLPPRE